MDRQKSRQPKPIAVFANEIRDVNMKLSEVDTTPLLDAEFIAARLYTGPMFLKYRDASRTWRLTYTHSAIAHLPLLPQQAS